jgi:hypothetical protein
VPAKLTAAVAVLALALAVACGDGGGPSATGVIVDVRAASLTELEAFTLRSNDGDLLTFELAPDAERDTVEALIPGHLRTHALAGDQVEIFYREEGGRLLAVRLEDR